MKEMNLDLALVFEILHTKKVFHVGTKVLTPAELPRATDAELQTLRKELLLPLATDAIVTGVPVVLTSEIKYIDFILDYREYRRAQLEALAQRKKEIADIQELIAQKKATAKGALTLEDLEARLLALLAQG